MIGYAFVVMEREEDGKKAQSFTYQLELRGFKLHIEFALGPKSLQIRKGERSVEMKRQKTGHDDYKDNRNRERDRDNRDNRENRDRETRERDNRGSSEFSKFRERERDEESDKEDHKYKHDSEKQK